MSQSLKHFLKYLTIFLLFFNGFGAIYGGFHLIKDSSGSSLGMNTGLLKVGPFTDFLIPGIFLFTIIGLFSLILIGALLFKWRQAPVLITLEGSILLVWLIIQIILIQTYSVNQLIMGITGILLVTLGFLIRNPGFPGIKQLN